MKKKIVLFLVSIAIIFNVNSYTCIAKESSNESYPSYIEEFDELYFLENPYMEDLYNRYYYNMDVEFHRLDLSYNEFAQELRSDIEAAYTSYQDGQLIITLKHETEYDFREYVDIVFNTYIEFIKYYQYQDSTIQPDFSSCFFKPYVCTSNTTTHEYCTDIKINYINYD